MQKQKRNGTNGRAERERGREEGGQTRQTNRKGNRIKLITKKINGHITDMHIGSYRIGSKRTENTLNVRPRSIQISSLKIINSH